MEQKAAEGRVHGEWELSLPRSSRAGKDGGMRRHVPKYMGIKKPVGQLVVGFRTGARGRLPEILYWGGISSLSFFVFYVFCFQRRNDDNQLWARLGTGAERDDRMSCCGNGTGEAQRMRGGGTKTEKAEKKN